MSKAVAAGLALVLVGVSGARAQGTIDVSKVTCEQFTGYRITNPQNIAIWLNGYHNGKRDNTLVDTQVFAENFNKLTQYCITNPKLLVMQAAETLLGAAK